METNRFGIGDVVIVVSEYTEDPLWDKRHNYIVGEPMTVIGIYSDGSHIWYKTDKDPCEWYHSLWLDQYSIRSVREYLGVENPKAKTFLEKLEVMENKAKENMLYLSELDAINILVDAEVENDVDMAQATYVNVNAIERMKELTKKNLAKGDVRGT